MHIMVTWDITGAAAHNFEHWNDRLMAVLAPYGWVRPLRTTYVVAIPDLAAHKAIALGLATVATEESTGGLHILMTPGIMGGQYAGVVPREGVWPELNALSLGPDQKPPAANPAIN